MGFDLDKIVRANIAKLVPYSSARNEFAGKEGILLDANENSFGSPAGYDASRYPDPLQKELKEGISSLKGMDASCIFLGNGSDEAIDLLYRIFCVPGKDNVITCVPTYGMYGVSAAIHDVEVREILLDPDFDVNVERILRAADGQSKLIFLCSPNNPTGNDLGRDRLIEICTKFRGIVVVDEAYIDFSDQPSLLSVLHEYPNLVVLQTFSKAWGMAGIRLGMAFGSPAIIRLFNRVKAPYNVNSASQRIALEALDRKEEVDNKIGMIKAQRQWLGSRLRELACVRKVYPTSANFILAEFRDTSKAYELLKSNGIIVRDRSNAQMCGGCLRITVGTPEENVKLIEVLQKL